MSHNKGQAKGMPEGTPKGSRFPQADQGKLLWECCLVIDGGPRGQNRMEHLKRRERLLLRENQEGKKGLGTETGSSLPRPGVFTPHPVAPRAQRVR